LKTRLRFFRTLALYAARICSVLLSNGDVKVPLLSELPAKEMNDAGEDIVVGEAVGGEEVEGDIAGVVEKEDMEVVEGCGA